MMITLDGYLEIGELAKQGIPQLEVAQRTGLHREMVAKYMKGSGPPVLRERRERGSILDRFER